MIYCDESLSKGTYYSHFYGGVLVGSKDFYRVNMALEEMKTKLYLFGEIKWTKVTAPYLEKYKQMMDVFFGFVKEKRLKMRVMFQETSQIVPNHGAALQYHLLYYQFIKRAFGLAYHRNNPSRLTKVKLFFDEIPDTRAQNDDFLSQTSYPAVYGHCSGCDGFPYEQDAPSGIGRRPRYSRKEDTGQGGIVPTHPDTHQGFQWRCGL